MSFAEKSFDSVQFNYILAKHQTVINNITSKKTLRTLNHKHIKKNTHTNKQKNPFPPTQYAFHNVLLSYWQNIISNAPFFCRLLFYCWWQDLFASPFSLLSLSWQLKYLYLVCFSFDT